MADALRLVMMTFPQQWDGKGTLTLNVMLIPSVDPIGSPLIGTNPATPTFAKGTPAFRVIVNPGFDALPSTSDPGAITLTPTVTSAAPTPVATFATLQSAVTAKTTIAPLSGTPIVTPRIRKALPPSYFAVGGGAPDGNLTTSEDDFGCAVREAPAVPLPVPPPPPPPISWGEVISYALRQPVLAIKLGLRYELSITLPAANAQAFAQGGFVFVTLAATDPWFTAASSVTGSLRTHAARLPALTSAPRAVFAAMEFATDGGGGAPLDTAIADAQIYADGFAKMVHCSQPDNAEAAIGDGSLPPGADLGIQIGWDDENVVRWQNDQLTLLAARRAGTLASAPQAPLGVLGYRVDVADVTPAAAGDAPLTPSSWQSLAQVTSTLPAGLGTFTGELVVEPAATRPNTSTGADAWLPRYFATWRGGSLCEPDPIPKALTGRSAPAAPLRVADGLTTLLSYGHTYAFRVRLADISNGGPSIAAGNDAINPGPDGIALQTFQRIVPPKAPSFTAVIGGGSATFPDGLTVMRPLIGYPEVLYTHFGDTAAARDAMRAALVAQATGGAKIAGFPDPDVDHVEITVSVRHPLHDTGTSNGTFAPLYTTTRTLSAVTGIIPSPTDPGTRIDLTYIDATTIVGWAPEQPATGPLLIPRGRDVQITIRAGVRANDPSYFTPQLAQGHSATLQVRCEAVAEPALLQQADALEPIQGFLFRRPPNVAAPSVVSQLAEQLGVLSSGDNVLTAPPGRRVVFGASGALRTAISADGETLTFGATDELLRFWIVAIVLDLERDWTWDGLQPTSFQLLRGATTDTEATAQAVGSLTVPHVLGTAATTQPSNQERSRTHLILLDAIDPQEATGTFPQALSHRWFVKPALDAAGPALAASPPSPALAPDAPGPITGPGFEDQPLDLQLPIAIPPSQVPVLASVGLALSPHVAGPGYASTEQRARGLWLELTAPIANAAGDALFARVLAHGADPILYDAQAKVQADTNPPLALDPELVRVIVPGDTDDRAGLNAMTQLSASPDSATHFYLPLPPGIAANDPELFGFYTYELRVGHAGPIGDSQWWSTANGRFGSPLRVVGVQQPPPPLTCQAGRLGTQTLEPETLVNALRVTSGPALRFPLDVPVLATLAAQQSTITSPAPIATPATQASQEVSRPATSSLAAQPVAKPIAQPIAQPVAKPIVQPVAQPVTPVVQPVTNPVAQPVAQSVAELKVTDIGAITQLASASASLLGGLKLVPAPPSLIVATAPYATPVLNGVPLVTLEDQPKTQLWFFLYAQAVQADGSSMRNVLLATAPGVYLAPRGQENLDAAVAPFFKTYLSGAAIHQRDRIGFAVFHQAEVDTILKELHLSAASPLSVLAVELLPGGTGTEVSPPVQLPGTIPTTSGATTASTIRQSEVFPFGRILRSSPLTPVEAVC
jgi:hypothetical protein